MQINSIVQPTEIQPIEFISTGNHSAEKNESRKTEVKDAGAASTRESAEQPEKLQELKSALAEHNITLDISRDDQTDEIVVRLVNDETGEAIQQFPSVVSLKLAAVFAKLQGQFVDKQY
jgi:uncharacterized FlaG/YvyC family protein